MPNDAQPGNLSVIELELEGENHRYGFITPQKPA